jgi:uncharacterized Zn finger protein (UPF0148 family)
MDKTITCAACGLTYQGGAECATCGNLNDTRSRDEREELEAMRATEEAEVRATYGDLRAPAVMAARERWRSIVARLNRGR